MIMLRLTLLSFSSSFSSYSDNSSCWYLSIFDLFILVFRIILFWFRGWMPDLLNLQDQIPRYFVCKLTYSAAVEYQR